MVIGKRYFSFLIAGAIIIAGVVTGGILGKRNPDAKSEKPSRKAVALNIVTVSNGAVEFPVEMSGSIDALRKIEMYAEVSGVFRDGVRPFREGGFFRRGESLLVIEDSVFRNSVLAERSSFLNLVTLVLPDIIIDFPEESAKWKRYAESFRIESSLRPLPEPATDRERNYLAARNIYNKFYAIRSMEATLGKYRITAPFDGTVTLSEVNPGALIRTGQKIGEFAASGNFELRVSAAIRDAGFLKVNTPVMLVSDDFSGSVSGTIKRINANISPATQTVSVYIEVADPRLRDGMYLTALKTVAVPDAFAISRTLLHNDHQLFVLENSRFVLKSVRVIAYNNDKAVITGLPDGTKLPAEILPGMYDGMDARALLKP